MFSSPFTFILLSKTNLCASEPKYNLKTELGIKNSSILALPDGGGCWKWGPPQLRAHPEDGPGGFVGKYRIWPVSAGFVPVLPALFMFSEWNWSPENRKQRLRRGKGKFGEEREEDTYFKLWSLAIVLMQPFDFCSAFCSEPVSVWVTRAAEVRPLHSLHVKLLTIF